MSAFCFLLTALFIYENSTFSLAVLGCLSCLHFFVSFSVGAEKMLSLCGFTFMHSLANGITGVEYFIDIFYIIIVL